MIKTVLVEQSGVPQTPAPGRVVFYADTSHNVWVVDATGTARQLDAAVTPGGFLGRYVYVASDLDDPLNADWPIIVASILTVDTVDTAVTVRLFDDTVENATGLTAYTPVGASSIKFTFVWKAYTAPGTSKGVQPTIRIREFPHAAATEGWAETDFQALAVPTTTQWQTSTETISLSTLNMVAGRMFQMQLTRQPAAAGDTLVGYWVLAMFVLEYL